MDTCELCGGELTVLGQLGNRLHLRCRACGADSSVLVTACEAAGEEDESTPVRS